MQIKRIEIVGKTGHATIEREPGSKTIRIDSIVTDPAKGQQAWKTWEKPATMSIDDRYYLASELHLRTEGRAGTNSDVLDYCREIERFED